MSPGETDRLLALLTERPDGRLDPPNDHDITFVDEPLPYDPEYGPTLGDVVTVDGLVAVALANPTELPEPLRPTGTVGHYVPISPFRRRDVDRIELGCYMDRRLLDGTLPDRLIYLTVDPADRELRARIDRQHGWLERLFGDDISEIDLFVGAPGFETSFGTSEGCPDSSLERVTLREYG